MALIVLLLFIAVPILEIAVFIQVGGWIGTWPTIGLVILTAVAGTALLRAQGLSTLRRAQEALNRGEPPLRQVFDGACLLVAGALLLTPGFVTDATGLLLFVPAFRTALLAAAVKGARSGKVRFKMYGDTARGGFREDMHDGGFRPHGSGSFGEGGFGTGGRVPHGGAGPTDIEGEYREVNPGETDEPAPADEDPRRVPKDQRTDT